MATVLGRIKSWVRPKQNHHEIEIEKLRDISAQIKPVKKFGVRARYASMMPEPDAFRRAIFATNTAFSTVSPFSPEYDQYVVIVACQNMPETLPNGIPWVEIGEQ